MRKSPLRFPLLAAAALAAGSSLLAGAAPSPDVLTFSDPTQPGTVKVHLGRGDLVVEAADTQEVSVKTEARPEPSKPRKDGLRVISAASSFVFQESNNVVTLDATTSKTGRSNASFHLTVPRSATLIVQNAWGGEIHCRGLAGDIEINSMQGRIRLDDVSGGIVASTMNGEIQARIRALQEGKPLSFTSMNGEVVVRVPTGTKANVRLRTQNGSVLTDFDESVLVTKAETTAGVARGKGPFDVRGTRVLSAEVQDAIREASQLSATAIREALEAIREGLDAAKLDTEDARRKLDDARRQMERSRREAAARQRTSEEKSEGEPPPAPVAPAAPRIPAPPKPPIPTITGGKLVTGTLNGGGPEISVTTMNGDVILRKLEATR